MKIVHFHFNGREINCKQTTKTFKRWTGELPKKGDFISYDKSNYRGEIVRVEWNLDIPNEVYVLINSIL